MFLVIALTVGNALLRRWPSHHAAIFITGAVVIQAGHLLMIPLRRLAGLPPYSVIEFLLASIIGVVLVFVTSGFGSFRSYRADIARVLESTLDADLTASIAASRQVAQLARESARILHGTVQTRLIACAVAIEQAAGTRDVDAFQHALSEAHAVLAQPTRFVEDDTTTLIEEVQRKVGLWSGLCVIDTIVSPDLAASGGRLARDIGRVVEEGVSNAIRHGRRHRRGQRTRARRRSAGTRLGVARQCLLVVVPRRPEPGRASDSRRPLLTAGRRCRAEAPGDVSRRRRARPCSACPTAGSPPSGLARPSTCWCRR